jgi:hypothetical protein
MRLSRGTQAHLVASAAQERATAQQGKQIDALPASDARRRVELRPR